ncbi:7-deoxyloganetin glucosyltransferase-like [Aristolochia californica]|uniref:7-deoxyloganetin glucosyltransferase-like n=1 Tax=Aristolochia californica TaxID=171875 RepID=UPI0035DECE91
MGSIAAQKPHAVCISYPAQGHVNPMLKLAKLLHFRGFHITFVNTEYNHRRLLRSRGPHSLDGLKDFRFETIPDGLPPSSADVTQDIPALCESTSKNCLAPFRALLGKLNGTPNLPRISCIISDGCMSFTLDAAEELQIPDVLFWTPSACGLMGYLHYQKLIDRGIVPLKDESQLTNGHLESVVIDWIPGMENIRLSDLPSFVRTTEPHDILLNFLNREAQRTSKAAAVILNSFDEFEHDILQAMASIVPPLYTIGPLAVLCDQIPDDAEVKSLGSNLWKEDTRALEWLGTKEPNSVVYVNFGSITVMTLQQMVEFAWGLANSNCSFLWVIRPDLVRGDSAILPQEFLEVTSQKGLILSWVPQEQVLAHPTIAGFLTHSGWNSTLESVCNGVPMISWPFFAEQQTNCRFATTKWGIGMEIDNNVKRDVVEGLVRELMVGDKGKEMKKKALEWKAFALKSAQKGGSSYVNLDRLVKEVLLSS